MTEGKLESPTPRYKYVALQVQETTDDVEVLSLLVQILAQYPRADRLAIAAWLWAKEGYVYGVTIPPRQET